MPIDLSTPLVKQLPLADKPPREAEVSAIDLLIGSDYYHDLITSEKIELKRGLYLIGSKLGWIVCGRQMAGPNKVATSTILFVQSKFKHDASLSFSSNDSQLMERFNLSKLWELDTIGIKDHAKDIGDDEALRAFHGSIRYEEGRYSVKWPWKADGIDLPTNYSLALGRLKSLLRRYSSQPDVLAQYHAVLDDQLRKGIIEPVVGQNVEQQYRVHYIPHHAVITPQKESTKLRIVYDASAKARKENMSLNECLYRGPILLDDLAALLVRFRLNETAIVADIERAFLQVSLQEADRDVTRFLWVKNSEEPATGDNLQIFRFTRVPFGVISSPFLLSATIAHHLQKLNTATASKIASHIYVDNVVTGVDSYEDALLFYAEAKKLFDAMAMNIRQFASNDRRFIDSLPLDDRTQSTTISVLGVPWDTLTDTLSINVPASFSSPVFTKRSILSFIASIYDPLGFFSPSVLLGKMFLQSLWVKKLNWDDVLTEEQQRAWKEIIPQITSIRNVSLSRMIASPKSDFRFELHGFADASKKAYGACIYLRVITPEKASSHLLVAKSRVAPVESVSIPRLELIAVQVASQLMEFASKALNFSIDRRVLWTDSQCVLHWLNSAKSLSVFVRNRVNKIKSGIPAIYRYVRSEENPADLASRGLSAGELSSATRWWHGPQFLSDSDEVNWPVCEILKIDNCVQGDISAEIDVGETSLAALEEVTAEISIGVTSLACVKTNSEISPIDFNRFSSLSKLLRVTAWVHRFINRLKGTRPLTKNLSADEVKRAKLYWLQVIQRTELSDTLDAVKHAHTHKLKDQLGLWLDNKGLIRCGGRLTNSDLSENEIHPILLPKGSHFTRLIIDHAHRATFHSGVSHTLARIRDEYWIPSGRAKVYHFIQGCPSCKKFEGGPYKASRMPPLPKQRVNHVAPFQNTGLDYLGPLFVKGDSTAKKVWVCIFTCMSVRAVHLEIVQDLSAAEFLLVLKRFVSRRGVPEQIMSDNAKQFRLGSSLLRKIFAHGRSHDEISSYLCDKSITWKFIPARAPWMGGFYERLIRLVKQAFRKSLGSICLSYVQLQTVLTEIEAAINSRPLTYVGGSFETGQVISPAHFLSLNGKTGLPTSKMNEGDISTKSTLLEAWKVGQRHLEQYWKIWRENYLKNLRERWNTPLRQPRTKAALSPKVGDVVHVKGDGTRGTWKLAQIVELLSGADQMIRSAKIRLPSGHATLRQGL